MENKEIVNGDVVCLKSSDGYPKMTVEFHTPSNIHCVWFDMHQTLRRDMFTRDSLKLWQS